MSFDPFDSKAALAAVSKACKGKSLKPFQKVFDSVVAAKMDIDHLDPGGVSQKLSDECVALGEVVAAVRGQGARNVKLPDAAAKWLAANAPSADDGLAASAKAAVEKVRTNSAASAIAQEMGGWPAWKNYCRGLVTRLGKPAKDRPATRSTPTASPEETLRAKGCRLVLENKQVVEIHVVEAGQLADEDLPLVAGFKRLKKLRLRCQKVSAKGLQALTSAKALRELDIRDCGLKPAGYQAIELPRLQSLTLGPQVNSALPACEHFAGLREIHMPSSDLNDKGLAALARFPSLERVDVSHCLKLKGVAWEPLQSLAKLKAVRATKTTFSAAGVEALFGLTRLQELILHHAKIPTKLLDRLRRCKRLQTLDLSRRASDARTVAVSERSEKTEAADAQRLRRRHRRSCGDHQPPAGARGTLSHRRGDHQQFREGSRRHEEPEESRREPDRPLARRPESARKEDGVISV